MEQRQAAAEVFVDDGVGRTGDRLDYTKTQGQSARERGLARAKVTAFANVCVLKKRIKFLLLFIHSL